MSIEEKKLESMRSHKCLPKLPQLDGNYKTISGNSRSRPVSAISRSQNQAKAAL